MKIIKKIIPAVLSLLLAPSVLATDTQPIKISIEQQVAQFMAKEDIPALAIGIIQNGKVVFTSGHGVFDRKNNQPINTKTLFQIGSHAKPLTSAIALALIKEGKLKLSDRVVDHLPGVFPRASLAQFNLLTIEHLMVHRSGLPTYPSNVTRIDGDAMEGGYSEEKLLAALKTIELRFSPGQKWRYSNFNYAVLGYVLSKITNKTYAQLVKQYIADKYDVPSILVNLSEQQKHTQLATPYRKDNRQVATKPWDMGLLAPHGGLYATIEDFADLMAQQIAAYTKYNETGVASPLVSTQVIYDTQYSHMGEDYSGLSYGLGMFEATPELGMSVETIFYHGGDLDGFGSEYRFSPEYGVGVVMLTSSGGRKFIRFAMKIMDQLLIDAVENQQSPALALP
ncbi:MAG: beta-lactamase family protein [Gammaproteobacteria bacterium]|nr:beta-lactamase family protein [Gammaproteobacteria bacterium]